MNEYEVYQDILRRLQEEPATCSGCYKQHDPRDCPHDVIEPGIFDEYFECSHGHPFCVHH